MTGLLLLLSATIASMEMLARRRMIGDLRALSRLGHRVAAVVARRGVWDWAREHATRRLAARLFRESRASLGSLLLVAAPFLLVFALDLAIGLGVRRAWTSGPARTTLLVLSMIYLLARGRRSRRKSAEAPGERLLQRIALGTHVVPALSLELERRHWQASADARLSGPPVFVTGLARAGASMVTRALHEGGGFAALTGRDLPFPLAPNIWADLGPPLRRMWGPSRRAHGEGTPREPGSPEAIEEYFWRHHEGEHYIRPDGLSPVPPRGATIAAFADYMRLVQLRYDRPRYLSKNNNNVLRLPALLAAFPDAHLIHPFRDPLQQAASLLNRHRRTSALAALDPFRARFMGWLGHYEFGANRRRFLLPGGPASGDDPDHVDYWLKTWIAVHRHLLSVSPEIARRQLFVDYDLLVSDGARPAALLTRQLRLADPLAFDHLRPPAPYQVEPMLYLRREAYRLHATLRERAGTARDTDPSGPIRTTSGRTEGGARIRPQGEQKLSCLRLG